MRRSSTLTFALLNLALTLLAVLAPAALANDGVYGGNGIHPMPLTTSDVRMVEEHVVLTFDKKKDAWLVTCDFTFESSATEPTTLTVGFPFPIYAAEEGDIAVPRGAKEPKPGRPMVWDFKTTVRGKPVKAREAKTLTNPALPDVSYEFAYLWDVTFKPGEKVKIRNTYTHGVSQVVGGLTFANYVLKTGGLWAGGKIGRSRLEVHFPGARHVLCPPHHDYGEAPVRPPGGKVTDTPKGISIHWDLKDFRPTEDLFVCAMDLDQVAGMEFYMLQEGAAPLDSLTDAQLRLMRNQIYALHGYVFKSEDLKLHFATEWWYRPDPTFSPKRLSKDEQAFVARILAEEKRRKRAAPTSR